MSRPPGQSGFTLIESLIALTVGTIIVSATLGLLISNNRLAAAVTYRAAGADQLRVGVELLSAELKPLDPADGDLASLSPDTLRIRAFLESGTACGVTYSSGTVAVTLRRQGRWMQAGDSILVLADNDPALSADDVWVRGFIQGADTTLVCPDSVPAQRLTLTGLAGLPDTIRGGAAARSFEWRTYALGADNGGWYLTLQTSSMSQPEPVAGPLADPGSSPGGLRLRYFDSFGQPATQVTDVTQAEISIKVMPEMGALQTVPDSAMAWVRMR